MGMISWFRKMIRRSKIEQPKRRTNMEQYAAQYPKCRFVGFWRMYEDFSEYDEKQSEHEVLRDMYAFSKYSDMKDGLPWPAELIDENQDPALLERVARYVDGCNAGEHYCGFSSCRLCGEFLGTCDRTDGAWVWPDMLSHYLRAHKVRLPDDFIRHVISYMGGSWAGK